ncbi:histone H2B-like [Ascaphus truei]|uniref:histone H2B-like n=1 Tax=Ascaphus truei TaxID=8439 RepID=UPI003F595CC9
MAPRATQKSPEKAPKRAVRQRERRRNPFHAVVLRKMLKEMHPHSGITAKAMHVLTSFVTDILCRVASEGSMLSRHKKQQEPSSQEIQAAVRHILPGELAKHAGCQPRTQQNSHQAQQLQQNAT